MKKLLKWITKEKCIENPPTVMEIQEPAPILTIEDFVLERLKSSDLFPSERNFVQQIIARYQPVRIRDTYIFIEHFRNCDSCNIKTESIYYEIKISQPFNLESICSFFKSCQLRTWYKNGHDIIPEMKVYLDRFDLPYSV